MTRSRVAIVCKWVGAADAPALQIHANFDAVRDLDEGNAVIHSIRRWRLRLAPEPECLGICTALLLSTFKLVRKLNDCDACP